MSNLENKILIILILLACFLSFNIGYAKYSTASLDTVSAINNKQFSIEFSNPKIINSIGANEEKSYVVLSTDKKSLQLNVADLAYPGAKVEFCVDIVNNGILPAKINSIVTDGFKDNSAIRIMGLDNINSINKILEPGKKYSISFSIGWDKYSNLVTEETMNFKIRINYEQAI